MKWIICKITAGVKILGEVLTASKDSIIILASPRETFSLYHHYTSLPLLLPPSSSLSPPSISPSLPPSLPLSPPSLPPSLPPSSPLPPLSIPPPPPSLPTYRFLQLRLTLAPFKDLHHHPGHFSLEVTDSTTIHGLCQVSIQSQPLKNITKDAHNETPPLFKQSQCIFSYHISAYKGTFVYLHFSQ